MLSKMQQIGRVVVDLQNTQVKFAAVNLAKDGTRSIVDAVAGKKIRVLGGQLHASAADGSITFLSGTTAISGVIPMFVGGTGGAAPGTILDLGVGSAFGAFETAVGEALQATLAAGNDVDGWLVYCEV